MLVLNRATGAIEDKLFRDLPGYLSPGDCLILNDTRVMPSRIYGSRVGGTRENNVEVLFLKPLTPDRREWQCLVRPGRRLHEGAVIEFDDTLGGVVVDTGERGERRIKLMGGGNLDEVLQRLGHMPLPPYIRRNDNRQDRERYQTVFSREAGSAAAPTAGLHFTEKVLGQCRDAGAIAAYVTLHVGLGTFSPLRKEIVEEVKLHSENYVISSESASLIESANRRIAVGTTSVRTVESWQQSGQLAGETDIFIYPGYQFRRIDGLLTNFHLPESSLLMLVAAFGGKDQVLAAYRHAVMKKYRFFSYGDCMLIL